MKGLPMIRAAFQILLAAVLAIPALATAATVEYIHTDALGSPVAVTNSAGQVIERREYEPYGRQLAPTALTNGPGYTGHVTDAVTGLTYMQQRYFDPLMGRFLSVDPVTAYDSKDMRYFNRYAYAFANPYKFTDPDGRQNWLSPSNFNVNPTSSRAGQLLDAAEQHAALGAKQFADNIANGKGTLQVGVRGEGALSGGKAEGEAGFAFDRQGNIGVYTENGGSLSTSPDANLSIAVTITDAPTINDLAGTAMNYSASGGDGIHGTATVSQMKASDGSLVTGAGAAIGGGAGGSLSAGSSYTTVVPLNETR